MSPEPRPSVSAEDVYQQLRPHLGAVPAFQLFETCEECLGPVAGYSRCYTCKQLFSAAPAELDGMVVPMSTARSPSPWYSKLVGYKNFQRQHQVPIAALAHLFANTHRHRIEGMLAGEVEIVALVPSTRGKTFEQQPLRETLSRSQYFRERLQGIVSHRTGTQVPRKTYTPEAFGCSPAVQGARILLIEDLWVSGSKAVSTAGALLEAGAAGVVIAPIARMIEPPGYYPADHPYFAWMSQPHDYTRWPR